MENNIVGGKMKLTDFVAKHNYDLKKMYIPISFLSVDVARQILFDDVEEKELKWLSKLILDKTISTWNTDFFNKYLRLIDYSVTYKGDLKQLVMFVFARVDVDPDLNVGISIHNPTGLHLMEEMYHPSMIEIALKWMKKGDMALYLNRVVERKIQISIDSIMRNMHSINGSELTESTVEYLYNHINTICGPTSFGWDDVQTLNNYTSRFVSMCSTHIDTIKNLIISDCGKGSLTAVELAKILFIIQFNHLSSVRTNEVMSQLSQHIDRVYSEHIELIISIIFKQYYYIHVTDNTFNAMVKYYKGHTVVCEKFIEYMLQSEERVMTVYNEFKSIILSSTRDDLFKTVTFQAGITDDDVIKLSELYPNDFEFISNRFEYRNKCSTAKTKEESLYQLSMFFGSYNWLEMAKNLIGK